MFSFLKSFYFAIKGIKFAFGQRNFRIQCLCGIIAVSAGFYFEIATTEWMLLIVVISLVLTLEMLNSAIENLVNLVTDEWKPLAGKIKDIAAGAVLVSSIGAAIIGIIIFWKYIFEKIA